MQIEHLCLMPLLQICSIFCSSQMVPIPIFNVIFVWTIYRFKIKMHTDIIGTGAHLIICPAQINDSTFILVLLRGEWFNISFQHFVQILGHFCIQNPKANETIYYWVYMVVITWSISAKNIWTRKWNQNIYISPSKPHSVWFAVVQARGRRIVSTSEAEFLISQTLYQSLMSNGYWTNFECQVWLKLCGSHLSIDSSQMCLCKALLIVIQIAFATFADKK